jgi:hypothetical protein
VLLFVFLAPAVYGQVFVFNGIKLGCSLKEQDKTLSFKKLGESYDVTGLADIGVKRKMAFVNLIDGKIEAFTMTFSATEAGTLLSMVTEKYGKPVVLEKNKMRTYGGAVLDTFTAIWELSSANILLLSNLSDDVTKGTLGVSTKKSVKQTEEKAKNAKKKAIGNL